MDNETVGKRVFAQMYHDVEITNLNIPSMIMPKTFKNLLYIGYSIDRKDAPTRSDESNDSFSSNTSSRRSPPKEWEHIFAEDGSLRFDNILPALPPMESELLEDELILYGQTLECAVLALAHYNANNNEGAEYELVAPVLSNIMKHGEHFLIQHANFIAKPKNCDYSPSELFYAEVVPSNFLKTRDQDPVREVHYFKTTPP